MTQPNSRAAPDPGEGVALSNDENTRLKESLDRAGLRTDLKWDSLDVVCVLTVMEHEVGLTFPGGVRPGHVRDFTALLGSLARAGARVEPRARLRLDLGSQSTSLDPVVSDDTTVSDLYRERRLMEYRLALAAPNARTAVSRTHSLTVLAVADSADDLPSGQSLLDIAANGPDRQPRLRGASDEGAPPSIEMAALRVPGAGLISRAVVSAFEAFVSTRGGESWMPPSPLIRVADLRRLGYYDAHPEQVVLLSSDVALLPAVCLPAYAWMARDAGPRLGTLSQTVFRRELFYDEATGRLPAFTQRDIVWRAASLEEDFERAASVEAMITELAESFCFDYRWADADDPFYISANAATTAKRELRVRTASGEIAVASINRHADHFVRRGYGRAGEVTGCAGVGLQRFVLAALESRESLETS